jgi:hypothetical protein
MKSTEQMRGKGQEWEEGQREDAAGKGRWGSVGGYDGASLLPLFKDNITLR